MTDDNQAIRRVLDGDTEGFRILVQRYQRPVFAMIRNMIHNPADCEEIAQEVFLSAYRNLSGFDPARASFSTWLFTIARNKCFSAMRKRTAAPAGDPPPGADLTTPDASLAEKELFEALDAALDALPPEQRTAFVLAELVGLSREQIARVENVEVGTVRSRLSRAKGSLRSLLGQFAGGAS